jgi:cytochrome d ubiquinol oxidase subunit I
VSDLDIARLQFATTTAIHFLFVLLTLGLVTLLVILQTTWLITKNPKYERHTRFWGRLYVINYFLGIVTGVVLELQFGLNWSGLSHYLGDVFGAPLALETLLAFFLESTFLGLWMFGWAGSTASCTPRSSGSSPSRHMGASSGSWPRTRSCSTRSATRRPPAE